VFQDGPVETISSASASRTSAAAEVPAGDTEAPPGGYPTAAAQADTLHEKHRGRMMPCCQHLQRPVRSPPPRTSCGTHNFVVRNLHSHATTRRQSVARPSVAVPVSARAKYRSTHHTPTILQAHQLMLTRTPVDFQGTCGAHRTARRLSRFASCIALSPGDPIPGPC
jgi:hypothetical protein